MQSKWGLTLTLAFVCGCGPTVDGGDPADSSGEEASASTSSEPDCSDYLDEPGVARSRTFLVTNLTDAPLFLLGAGGCSLERVHVWGSRGSSPSNLCSCSTVMNEVSCGLCTSCLPTAMRLEPHATYAEAWLGDIYASMAIPDSCQHEEACAEACDVRLPAGPDGYFASVRATTDPYECETDPSRCECDSGTQGWCMLEIEAHGEDEHEAGREFAHPDERDVEIDFDL